MKTAIVNLGTIVTGDWRDPFAPGDSILMYSDGFESAFSDASGIINERYRTEFAKLAGPTPTERFNTLVSQLDEQEGSLHQRDDLTALLLTIAS